MKGPDSPPPALFYTVMLMAGLVIIIAGMMHARVVLIPLMMAIFITIICNGPMAWLEKKGVSHGLSILLITAFFAGIVMLSALIVGSSVDDFSHNLPEYENKLKQQMEHVYGFLGSKGIDLKGKGAAEIFSPAAAMKYAGVFIDGLSNLLANSFVVFFLVIFMLYEATVLPEKLQAIYGDDDRETRQLIKFNESVQNYMSIKVVVSLITGGLATLSLLVIGVDYPVMWGMIAFAFNFVPNIGSIIAAIPPVLLALVQLGPGSSLAVAGCYLAINMIMGNIVEPRFMGKGLGLSTLVVFLSLLFWGWVLGPVGMLLSVILTMKFKIMMDSNEDTRWIGVLLGPGASDMAAEDEQAE